MLIFVSFVGAAASGFCNGITASFFMKNILLLGSGGRESALAWKLSRSELCGNFFIAPGNAGTSEYGINVPISYNDFPAIKQHCITNKIDIVIPGPEEPLVAGIYDYFKNDIDLKHIVVAGPSKAGAVLEGSKAFSKKFMKRHNIPTAGYFEVTAENFEQGIAYIKRSEPPYVLKADGLAAGKGVVIVSNPYEAIRVMRAMIKEQQFGAAGSTVVIEQFLSGIELSVFALTDGKNYVLLPEAKDYKRIGVGDTGPNTGGMGSVSPVPFADKVFMDKVRSQIIEPTIAGLQQEHMVYKGFIFFGLINVGGEPFVIEYNCRLGDPETESIMPRIENDFVDLLLHMEAGTLDKVVMKTSPKAAATVMLVSGGYPDAYEKGKVMTGIVDAPGSILLHAGTVSRDGMVRTNGGRVLAVTSLGIDLKDALDRCYANAANVEYAGKYYRTDIGFEFV